VWIPHQLLRAAAAYKDSQVHVEIEIVVASLVVKEFGLELLAVGIEIAA